MSEYFVLSNKSTLTLGFKQSLLVDFAGDNIKKIPNSLFKVVKLLEDNKILNIKKQFLDQEFFFDNYLDFLSSNWFGLIVDSSVKHNMVKSNNNWDSPSEIDNASIILKFFDKQQITSILKQLQELNCFKIHIRIDYPIVEDVFIEFLDLLQKFSIRYVELVVDAISITSKVQKNKLY